jgi:hypothetical protein
VRVPDGLSTLPTTPRGVLALAARQFEAAALAAPAVRWAAAAVGGDRFDLVVANDARVLALADHLAAGAPVWADLHEWAPEERTHVLSWRLLVSPFMTWLCARFLPRAAAVSTVGAAIAELYLERFGVEAQVVRNAGPFRDLAPGGVDSGRIRLVHSGAAVHGRSLETMVEAMALLDDRFTLDLYLVPGGDGGAYLRRIQQLAAGDARIRFVDPVTPDELPAALNAYDVGVFWIPPTHTNARLTLPNKFFDYVQARLAIAIGPTVEMVSLVQQHGLGVVATGFDADACAASLRVLDAEQVAAFKRASHAVARELSFDHEAEAVVRMLTPILA